MWPARLAHISGWHLVFLSAAMMLTFFVGLLGDNPDQAQPFAISAFLTAFVGTIILLAFRGLRVQNDRRVGFLVPVIAFVVLPVFASLPYIFSGYFSSFFEAYFEAVSGLTTTGSSAHTTPLMLPEIIRFWRVFTSWLGGGLVVIYSFAIFAYMDIGGLGITRQMLPLKEGSQTKDRLKATFSLVAPLYLGLTVIVAFTSVFAGLSPIKSIMLAFDSVSTGGFLADEMPMILSNHPSITPIIILAMFLGGLCVSGLANIAKGNPFLLFRVRETGIYLRLTIIAIVLIMLFEFSHFGTSITWGLHLSRAIFLATSAMSTTGYGLDYDYVNEGIYMAVLIGTLVMIGGTTGSTSGGLRIMRLIVIFRHAMLELRKLTHKHDASPLVYDGKVVDSTTISNLWLVFMLFMATTTLGTLGFTLHGLDILNATAASISSLANAGPSVYLMSSNFPGYETLPLSAQMIAVILMIAGRLEVVLLVVLFAKNFWKH